MHERQERIALILLLTVLAIVLAGHLILTALRREPFAVPFTDEAREGDLVVLTGEVDGMAMTSSGGHILVSVNGTRVFIPAPASREVSLRLNDSVRIYGIVQIYQGRKEVVVRDAADVLKGPFPR